jgi:phosphatidylglycerol---prolipoprotein diacylglyceryl transferase
MHAICFKLGALTIHWYGVCMALGFLAGLANWIWLGCVRGRNAAFASDLLFWVMVAGLLGARTAYVLTNLSSFAGRPYAVFFFHEGGLVYYGGFIGAAVALPVFARLRGLSVLALYDFVVTSVPLAHALGRIGCFLNGCCFGRPWDGCVAVRFPDGTLPWWAHVEAGWIPRTALRSAAVHPVQLYEAAFNLLLYGLLVVGYRRRPRDGMLTALYLFLYPAARFGFELLRGDTRPAWAGLSLGQWTSIALVLAGLAVLRAARRGTATQ